MNFLLLASLLLVPDTLRLAAGVHPGPMVLERPTVLLGESFVEWTRDYPGRIALFMNLMGFYQYQILDDAERARLKPQYADMPVWPRPGSIRVIDGVVLVRLGRCEPIPGGGEVCDSKPVPRIAAAD